MSLYAALKRLGPGSDDVNREMVERLSPAFRGRAPDIVDMGAGTGAACVPLAKALKRPVAALEKEPRLIDALVRRAAGIGHRDRIHAVQGDMAKPPFRPARFDIVWAEACAYAIGFETALQAWRPLLKVGGYVVISELIWIAARPSAQAKEFWAEEYPAMADGPAAREAAVRSGFEVIGARNLPKEAWWDHYYRPLVRKARDLGLSDTPAGRAVLADLRFEMAVVEKRLGEFEYAMYLLKKRDN